MMVPKKLGTFNLKTLDQTYNLDLNLGSLHHHMT
jgi:hypothetical protein